MAVRTLVPCVECGAADAPLVPGVTPLCLSCQPPCAHCGHVFTADEAFSLEDGPGRPACLDCRPLRIDAAPPEASCIDCGGAAPEGLSIGLVSAQPLCRPCWTARQPVMQVEVDVPSVVVPLSPEAGFRQMADSVRRFGEAMGSLASLADTPQVIIPAPGAGRQIQIGPFPSGGTVRVVDADGSVLFEGSAQGLSFDAAPVRHSLAVLTDQLIRDSSVLYNLPPAPLPPGVLASIVAAADRADRTEQVLPEAGPSGTIAGSVELSGCAGCEDECPVDDMRPDLATGERFCSSCQYMAFQDCETCARQDCRVYMRPQSPVQDYKETVCFDCLQRFHAEVVALHGQRPEHEVRGPAGRARGIALEASVALVRTGGA